MENDALNQMKAYCVSALHEWINSCRRGKKVSRNTIAVGIVALDHLRNNCPVTKSEVISVGGEIKGSRSALSRLLNKYGIPNNFLKEVTTRQAHQDAQRLFEAFEWGSTLSDLPDGERDSLLSELINELTSLALDWLHRQNLKFDLDRNNSPLVWVHLLLEQAEGISGGIVEQHLVGAKLERRYQGLEVSNYPAHAADVQTDRRGDFTIHNTVYHVTASPGLGVIEKCVSDLRAGMHPMLLVPRCKVISSEVLAEIKAISQQVTIISIEDFIALNIIELAAGDREQFFHVLQEIINIYNRRLSQVETDWPLKIEIK